MHSSAFLISSAAGMAAEEAKDIYYVFSILFITLQHKCFKTPGPTACSKTMMLDSTSLSVYVATIAQ